MVMMKDMNGVDGVSSSSNSNNGAGDAALRPQGNIRKNRKPEDVQLFLRRLKQYLLYSKLRSLIPSASQQQQQQQEQQQPFDQDHQIGERHEEATEVEIDLHEIPIAYRSDSDHEDQEHINVIAPNGPHYDLVLETKQDEDEGTCTTTIIYESDDEEGGTCKTTIVFESDDHEEEKQSEKAAFVPSVKIERMDDTILINTVVIKQQALTSSLFKILEDENLDIVFENQYRTETKVCHTIQVRLVQPKTAAHHLQYNVDRLEKRLQIWAKGEPESML